MGYCTRWTICSDDGRKDGEKTITVPKPRQKYDEADRKKIEKGFKAKTLLVCGIGPDEYNRVSACESAKKI